MQTSQNWFVELYGAKISNLQTANQFLRKLDNFSAFSEAEELKKVKLFNIADQIRTRLIKCINGWPELMRKSEDHKKHEKLRQLALDVIDSSYANTSKVIPDIRVSYPVDISAYVEFVTSYGDPELLKLFAFSPEYAHMLKLPETRKLLDLMDPETRKSCLFMYDLAMSICELTVPMSINHNCVYTLEQAESMNMIRYQMPNNLAVYGNRKILPIQRVVKRFNILTNNLFKDLDMSGYYITGSMLPICVATNPLEENFNINFDELHKAFRDKKYLATQKKNYKFIAYAEYYYPSRNSLSADKQQDFKDGKTFKLSDIDIFISGNLEELDSKANQLLEMLTPRNPGLQMKKIRSKLSYRYRFFGGRLHRNIELFSNWRSPINVVSNFHVDPVRMYMTGNMTKPDIRLVHSCVSTLISGICDTTRFISCDKKLESIQSKNICRGFAGTFIPEEIKKISPLIDFVPDRNGYRLTKNCRIFKAHIIRDGLVKYPINQQPDDSCVELSEFEKLPDFRKIVSLK